MDRAKVDAERVAEARKFGRIDDEGRVFVRLPENKIAVNASAEETAWKFVGQYVTGEIDKTMELFVRRFVNEMNKCDMLEERLEMPELNITTTEIDTAIKAFRGFLEAKNAVGDYAQFQERLERIEKLGGARKEYNKRIKKELIDTALERLRQMTAELEKLLMGDIDSINWKQTSPIIDNAVDEWKKVRQSLRLPEKECNELWERYIAARKKLGALRSVYFTNLKSRNAEVQRHKNRIIEEARSLQDIEDFSTGVRAFKRLQGEWTEIGYGLRKNVQAQWRDFSTLKDHFYGRLTEYNKSRHEESDEFDPSSRGPRHEKPQWNNDLSHLSNNAFSVDALEELKRKFEVGNSENDA
jgi:hypothetical protein